MKIIHALALSLSVTAFVPAAQASVLYKSVSANGVVTFSDTPPENADRVERIPMTFQGSASSAGYTSSGSGAPGAPIYGNATPVAVARFDELKTMDVAVSDANARVDHAENALAAARRGTWSPHDGLRLAGSRATVDDVARVEAIKRDVLLARQSLLETLRSKNAVTPANTVIASR
jgi:hypothetical protein